MTDQKTISTDLLFLDKPGSCPYFEGRVERKVFTFLTPSGGTEKNSAFIEKGFRRSLNFIYRPQCPSCNACKAVRIPLKKFAPKASQRRTLKSSRDLTLSIEPNLATEDHFNLFSRYLKSRHSDGGMGDMAFDAFRDMVEAGPVTTKLLALRDAKQKLMGALLYDVLDDGSASAVYSYFDPDEKKRSLGTFLVLKLCEMTGGPFVYLGYWVKNSRKMDYKSKFRPLEMFMPNGWTGLKDELT